MNATARTMNTLTRRILVGLAGGIVLIAGLAMLVLPGPGLVVIPLGLAILASELPWAHRWAQKFKDAGLRVIGKVRRRARRS